MAATLDNSAWVEWMSVLMGGKSRQLHAATFPPDRFHCLLDELPVHLIPAQNRARLFRREPPALFLNPECILCRADQLPDAIATWSDVRSAFALQGMTAWVPEPATGSLLPFWLGPKMEAAVRSLKPNHPAPHSMDAETRTILWGARILVSREDRTAARQEWERNVCRASVSFRARGYAPIPDLIHPFHIASLRRYYRYLIRNGAIKLGDRQSQRRYAAYNEPVARFFHQSIASTLSAVAGKPLKPSYVYLASYISGAELPKHTDRAQCEFSVTLCLDFAPEPKLETPWPLELDTPGGAVKVYQAMGDGLAYRGTRLAHYRGILGEGQTSTSIFFHYVPADFTGSLD